MYYSFSGKTADDVWSQAMTTLFAHKESLVPSRVGDTIELIHTAINIEDPTQRWVLRRTPPISIGYALAELMWILAGSNDAQVINYWNPILPKFAGTDSKYHGAYGYRIRRSYGYDQLEQAYQTLKCNPNSRQTVILIWDPRLDTPDNFGQPVSGDIPCNICSLLKIREGKLEWTQIMRSNDVYRGLPYNIIQYTSLQEILAGWLKIQTGSYFHYSDSLHLYLKDLDKLEIAEEISIKHNDKFVESKEECNENINQIYSNMVQISTKNISEIEMAKLSEIETQRQAYKNIMYMIALYASEKKGYMHIASELICKCTNSLYVYLWNTWKSTKSRGGNDNG